MSVLCITSTTSLTLTTVVDAATCATTTNGLGYVALLATDAGATSLSQLNPQQLAEFYAAGFTVMGISMLIAWGFKQLLKPFFGD